MNCEFVNEKIIIKSFLVLRHLLHSRTLNLYNDGIAILDKW